jgi:MraZ protein
VELTVLMGHAPAKVDEKGRLKIPADFRKLIEEKYGLDCFITSTDGQQAVIYPMPVWADLYGKLSKVPSSSTAKRRYLERLNYYGQVSSIDAQGRVLVPTILRQVAGIAEEVVVIGSGDYLLVENQAQIAKRLAEPMTDEDFKELELHGV